MSKCYKPNTNLKIIIKQRIVWDSLQHLFFFIELASIKIKSK